MNTIRLSMAQALIRFLDQQYFLVDAHEYKFVEGIMGIFGHGNVTGLGEALENEEHGLRFIRGNNEQGLTHAASAFAKQHDRKRIYAVTSSIGPGATNMVSGAALATINRLPLLLLPGDVFADRRSDPVLQQLEHPLSHQISVNECLRPVSRYFDRIERPEQLMIAMIKAFRVLTDPVMTGAVTICLPQDVQGEAFLYPKDFFKKRIHRFERRIPDDALINEAARLIAMSERPLIIAGGGIHYSDARDALTLFINTTHIPVAETQAGKSALKASSKMLLGGIGVIGTSSANELANKADCVIAIGTRLSDFVTSSHSGFMKGRLISINIDAFDNDKMEPFLSITADAKLALLALSEALEKTNYASPKFYQDEVLLAQKRWEEIKAQLIKPESRSDELLSQVTALAHLNDNIEANAVVVSAAGSLPGDLQRLWQSHEQKGYHLEYGYSCMGYEVAGGLGVKLANPARPVWVMVGDGSFLMMHSEIITALEQNAKINIVLFDNQGFACISGLQRAHGSKGFGNDRTVPVSFALYAKALGLMTWHVKSYAELRSAVEKAKAHSGSTLIELKVAPDSMSPSFNTWWRVGLNDCSKSPTVQVAHQRMSQKMNSLGFFTRTQSQSDEHIRPAGHNDLDSDK